MGTIFYIVCVVLCYLSIKFLNEQTRWTVGHSIVAVAVSLIPVVNTLVAGFGTFIYLHDKGYFEWIKKESKF
jgi:hypothetical protein